MADDDGQVIAHSRRIDTSDAPIIVGAQLFDAVLPAMLALTGPDADPFARVTLWHGFLAAAAASAASQLGLQQTEGLLQACIGYGRQMAAEESEARKGAH